MKEQHPKSFPREQRAMIVSAILGIVVVLVILQLWLLTSTMNAYLGADYQVVWAGAAVSAGCLLLNLGLLRHLYRLDRRV